MYMYILYIYIVYIIYILNKYIEREIDRYIS